MTITNIAVIGGGTLGQGLANIFASYGYDVILIEKTEASLESSLKSIEDELDYEISRWRITEAEKKSTLSRIKGSIDINRVKDCDLLFEAVQEDIETKMAVFTQADGIAKDEAIFITNTATLSVTQLASSVKRRDKVIGTHFLTPVVKVPMVEIIRGVETSKETYKVICEFAKTIEKKPIGVYEYPGFVTPRMFIPLLNEAMYIAMEGISSIADIDEAMKLGFGFDMGPFRLADKIGLDVIHTWMESLFKELGDSKYKPCPMLRKIVRARHYGEKTGRGFYIYDEKGKAIEPIDKGSLYGCNTD